MDIEEQPRGMELGEKAVEALNFSLDDLAVKGTERFVLADFSADEVMVQQKVRLTCLSLLGKLNYYHEEPFCTEASNLETIYSSIKTLNPNFSEISENFAFRYSISPIVCLELTHPFNNIKNTRLSLIMCQTASFSHNSLTS